MTGTAGSASEPARPSSAPFAAAPFPSPPAPTAGSSAPSFALAVLVVTGPALRTALLGGLLVAEGAIGTAFTLDAEVQAILLEAVVLGNLLAVFLLPAMMHRFSSGRIGVASAVATVVILALGIAAGELGVRSGPAATTALLLGSLAAGFAVAVLAPVTQILLNSGTEGNARATHTLQSLWNAGQPAGFVAASLIAGVLIGPLGWGAALIVPLVLAVVASIAMVASRLGHRVQEATPAPPPDRTEIALIVIALIAFELWSTMGTLRSWLSPSSLGSLAIMLVAGGYALHGLLTSPAPAISVTPFRYRSFAMATLVLFLFQFATTAEFEVLLLADLAKMSAIDLGDRTAVGNLAQIAGTALGGLMLVRRAAGAGLLLGLAITTVGLASYITYPWFDGLFYVTLTRSIVGFGSGLVTPILFTLALAAIGSRDQVAAGTWLVIATIAGTEVGLALLDIVLEVATATGGSARYGYIGVETVQFLIGLAVALAAAGLLSAMTLRPPLTTRAAGVVPPPS
jgi:MFS family permease